jgi:hypothetical protein
VKGRNDDFRLYVDSTGQWYLKDVTADPSEFIDVHSDPVNLNLLKNESNRLKLIAYGDVGYFYVNNTLLRILKLGSRLESGDVCIAAGITKSSGREGYQTYFENFTTWSFSTDLSAISETAVNLVDNSSFEHPLNEWQFMKGGMDQGTGGSIADIARTGQHSLAINVITSPFEMGWTSWQLINPIPISSDKSYLFGAWYYTVHGATPSLYIEFQDASQRMLLGLGPGCREQKANVVNEWVPISISFSPDEIPAGASQVQLELVQCVVFTEGQDTTIYYDDVFFGVLPENFPFSELRTQP